MSPVPEESKMKMPVAAMGAADDDEDSRWGLFVDSDMLDSMRSILQDKEGKDPYRHLKDDEFPRLDKLAGKERFGSTELGNEKIFDPLALQSRLTTNFRGLEKIGEGHFGYVYRGCGKEGGKAFAVKVTKDKLSDDMKRDEALREVKIWGSSHVQLYFLFFLATHSICNMSYQDPMRTA
ncbi:hypothetical protein SEVIR_7G245975v4 [Setaria viridis]|uniref:uncharacterized protein isoform X1 n=1 Tax=Setaria viridis TaxID=4556 RepID=UPI0014937DED|nr:uncharacterized protein LOC117865301 [Setaria viridis]